MSFGDFILRPKIDKISHRNGIMTLLSLIVLLRWPHQVLKHHNVLNLFLVSSTQLKLEPKSVGSLSLNALRLKEFFSNPWLKQNLLFSTQKYFCHFPWISFGTVLRCNVISNQRTLTCFVRKSITVQLTSCLTSLDLTEQ